MKTWVAFFRGINVGGNNKLPMKPLAALLETNGYAGVKTYIQSGNVLFKSKDANPALAARHMSELVLENFGFQPHVMVLGGDALKKAADANPFPQAHENPKTVHLYFLSEKAKQPNLAALEALCADGEAVAFNENVFYLYTPGGLSSSPNKLPDKVEKHLGVKATARNWNTVTKMLTLLDEV